MNQTLIQSAAAAGTFTIGGDLTVNRIGYGAMRITGPGIWGLPADKEAALATLRRAIMLGVTLIRICRGILIHFLTPFMCSQVR